MPQVSVVIPTFNNVEELLRCLQGLERSTFRDFEVLICVDGSTDGTPKSVANTEWKFPWKLLEHPDKKNHGRSAARNLALSQVSGTYTLFLDSDMEPSRHLLEKHLALAESGMIVSMGGIFYRNEADNDWARYIGQRGVAKFRAGQDVPFHYFLTANTLIRTEWWKSLNGFDRRIHGYGGEDMELGTRIMKNFHPKFIYNPEAKVHTWQIKSLDEALEQLENYGATGLPYIIAKHPELSHVWHADKVFSKSLRVLPWHFLTSSEPLKWIVRKSLRFLPWRLRKTGMNYLVISAIHQGLKRS